MAYNHHGIVASDNVTWTRVIAGAIAMAMHYVIMSAQFKVTNAMMRVPVSLNARMDVTAVLTQSVYVPILTRILTM